MVPNIKNAGALSFHEYVAAFDDLVARARTSKLTPADFQGTTISLTNPGTVGTMSSNPRLMTGQGCIVATGAIDYPAEYRGAADETRAHARHQQGDDHHLHLRSPHHSGRGIRRVPGQAAGAARWRGRLLRRASSPTCTCRTCRCAGRPTARRLLPGAAAAQLDEIAKEAGVIQLINAYRVRGHLIADLDPLGAEPATMPSSTLKPTASPSGISTANSSPARSAKPRAKAKSTLREILETLRQTYCGKIGAEYMHIQLPEQKRWLQQRMEPQTNNWPLAKEVRLRMLRDLIDRRRVRALPAFALHRPEALRARRRRNRHRHSGSHSAPRREPQRRRKR